MKKFTFITTLLLAFVSMAAFAADKPFKTIKVANADTWEMHGNCNFEAGKITNTSTSGGRAYNTKFADAFTGVTIPETGYKVTTVFTYGATGDANKNDFCIALLNSAVTPGTTWVAYGTNDNAIFALEQIYSPNAAGSPSNKVAACAVKKAKAANATAPTEDEIAAANVILSPGTKYQIDVNVNGQVVTYTISSVDAEGNLTAVENGSGSYELAEGVDNKVTSLYGCLSRANSNVTFEKLLLTTHVDGEIAMAPVQDLFWVEKEERDYFVEFKEGEVLHWVQLGDAIDVISGTPYTNGEEYTVSYSDAMDTREFEQGEECGKKIITCLASGTLRLWTSRADDDTNISDEVNVEVVCEAIQLPKPKAIISNVEAGFNKEYTLTVDNQNVLLKPEIAIHYVIKDKNGSKVSEANVLTGEKVNVGEGSIEFYSWDQKHEGKCYTASSDSTIINNVEYVEYLTKNYAITKAEAEGTMEGFTSEILVDNANKSHWDRIYSDQKYGYPEVYEADKGEVYDGSKEYVAVKEGFAFYPGTAIGTDDAKWPVQHMNVDALATAASPLVITANDKSDGSWYLMPLEGLVCYTTAVTNAPVSIEAQYVSDDENKPNFYVIHKRGGYDRPDKADLNEIVVVKAGEDYPLYRYDTAICDVKIMTYKGFEPDPDAGISNTVIEKNQKADNRIFNLAGQRVNAAAKGIKIQKGKKFIVK